MPTTIMLHVVYVECLVFLHYCVECHYGKCRGASLINALDQNDLSENFRDKLLEIFCPLQVEFENKVYTITI